MSKPNAASYIVLDYEGRPKTIGVDNVLWRGMKHITVFPTKSRALAAVKRTERYALKNGYDYDKAPAWWGGRIQQVKMEGK